VTSDPWASFLTARLDELEAAAKRAAIDPVGAIEAHFEAAALHHEQDWRLYPDRETDYDHGQADALRWASVAVRERMRPLSIHDPIRALREVHAVRELLRHLTDPETGEFWHLAIRLPGATSAFMADWLVCPFAAIWSEHPDYPGKNDPKET
jgi:hypothetical protein